MTLASQDYRLPLLLSSFLLLIAVVSLLRLFSIRELHWRIAAAIGLALAMLLFADVLRRAS